MGVSKTIGGKTYSQDVKGEWYEDESPVQQQPVSAKVIKGVQYHKDANGDWYEGEPVEKKKSSPSQDGSAATISTSPLPDETGTRKTNNQVIVGDLQTAPPPEDAVTLANKADELSKKGITEVIGRQDFFTPDKEASDQAKSINDDLVKQGYSPQKLREDFKDIPDNVLSIDGFTKPQLLDDYKNNPQLYERKIATAKWQTEIKDAFEKIANDNPDVKGQTDIAMQDIQNSLNNVHVGDYNQQRENLRHIIDKVNKFGGDKKEDILKNIGIDFSNIYGKEAGDVSAMMNDERYKKGDINSNQLAALHYLQDIHPQEANKYNSAFLKDEDIKDNNEAQIAKQEAGRKLDELGIQLRKSYLQEQLNPIQKEYQQLFDKATKDGAGYTPEDETRLKELEFKGKPIYDQLQQAEDDQHTIAEKYPAAAYYDSKNFAQELIGQQNTGLERFLTKTGEAFKNTGAGLYDFATTPFKSEQDNQLRQAEVLGSGTIDNTISYLKQENQVNKTFKPELSPELQADVDKIKKDDSLSEPEKLQATTKLLMGRMGEWGRTADVKTNLGLKSLMYGISDMASGLVPFMGLEMLTGGGATAGFARKFASTFVSAAATSFEDTYKEALERGEANPYAYATRVTAINSAAIAGAQTPDAIRKMFGTQKTAIGNLVSKMTDDEIEAALKEAPKALKTFKGSLNALKDKSIGVVKNFGSSAFSGVKDAGKINAFMTGGRIANDAISGELKSPSDYGKDFLIETLKFAVPSAVIGGVSKSLHPSDMAKTALFEAASKPEGFISALEQKIKDGTISPEDAQQVRRNVETVSKIYQKNSPVFKSLDDNAKRDYMYNALTQERAKEAAQGLPEKQVDKLDMEAEVAKHKNGLIIDPKTPDQLTKRKEQLEKSLIPEKDADGKNIEIPPKEVLAAKAEIKAIDDVLGDYESFTADANAKRLAAKKESDTKLSVPIEGVDEQGVPIGDNVPPPTEIKNESTEPIKEGVEASPTSIEPIPTEKEIQPIENVNTEGDEIKTGIKNKISNETRAHLNLPSVELPKMGKDTEIVQEGKRLVDSGEVNPREVVTRINEGKGGMEPKEAKAMQYYMHQLSAKETELREQQSEAKTPEEKITASSNLMQLSDEVDAATQANMTAGRAWSDVGNIRQIVTDDSFNPSREKTFIKDAYGGEIPKDVQVKLDTITKERDEALSAKQKVEEQLRQKMAAEGFEKIKKEAAKTTKNKEEKEKLKKEEEELIKNLKQAFKKDLGNLHSGIPIPKETLDALGKLAINYLKQGINGLEAMVDKIYENIKDDVEGISKKDIRNAIANYEPLTEIKETDRLNKKADVLDDKTTPPSVKTKGKSFEPSEPTNYLKAPKEQKKFRASNEWVKANQRVANAEYKMKVQKRRAFESQKNYYQRALTWGARLARLSVLSGYNVLGKLASAATIGSAFKRIPEQAIGAIYSHAFEGISKKAPIEGYWNAKSEAKFYKEFFNPNKFVKNAWEILKTGSSDLSKKFGGAEYEHVPGLYLPTDLHQIIKDPVKRATFESSFRNSMIWAEKNGLDINDPLVINSLENAAYKRAQYEIFQESNQFSRWFSKKKAELEKHGNVGATGKFLADFMIPVSTVPTNIARRLVTSSPFGLIRGGKEVIQAYRKGIENLTNDQAEHVMQQLKQGTLGTALWLIGWYGANQFGGLYSKFNPDKKRKEGDLAHDEMSVGGKMIPKPVQHALPLEIIQFAATARHVYDNYVNKKDGGTAQALYTAGLGSIGALLEQIPVLETGTHAIGATNNPYEAEKLKDDVKRRFEPQILKETGIIEDKKKKH